MAVHKWIFRFNGEAIASHGQLLLSVLENHSIEIIDNSLPKLLLVSCSEKSIEDVREQIDSRWVIAAENSGYQIPDTKRKLY
ncbi:MAG: hypothetical protein WKF87_17615 [Chryseolinea sp.]